MNETSLYQPQTLSRATYIVSGLMKWRLNSSNPSCKINEMRLLFRWLMEVSLSKQVSPKVQELIAWAVRLAGTRLDPDVVIRPHHRERGTLWPEAPVVDAKLSIWKGSWRLYLELKQKLWWLARKDAPTCAFWPLSHCWLSNTLQLFFRGKFLLKCNIHTEKCT